MIVLYVYKKKKNYEKLLHLHFSPNTGKYGQEKNYVFGHFSCSLIVSGGIMSTVFFLIYRSSRLEIFCKKGVLENFKSLFFVILIKRDSGTGVSLWILRNF